MRTNLPRLVFSNTSDRLMEPLSYLQANSSKMISYKDFRHDSFYTVDPYGTQDATCFNIEDGFNIINIE